MDQIGYGERVESFIIVVLDENRASPLSVTFDTTTTDEKLLFRKKQTKKRQNSLNFLEDEKTWIRTINDINNLFIWLPLVGYHQGDMELIYLAVR